MCGGDLQLPTRAFRVLPLRGDGGGRSCAIRCPSYLSLERQSRADRCALRVRMGMNESRRVIRIARPWVANTPPQIKKHISYFGGDPESITAIGESAGAGMSRQWRLHVEMILTMEAGVINYLSTTPHLHVHVPRIILESSTCWSIALLRPAQAQSSFAAVCSAFDIDPNSEHVVAQLRKVDVYQLMDKTGFARAAMRPVWDDVTITSDPREVLENPGLWGA